MRDRVTPMNGERNSMISIRRVPRYAALILTLVAPVAFSQHVIEHPMGLGFGYNLYGFGNPPAVLNED